MSFLGSVGKFGFKALPLLPLGPVGLASAGTILAIDIFKQVRGNDSSGYNWGSSSGFPSPIPNPGSRLGSLLGTGVGAATGMMVGGPLGAVVGGYLGNKVGSAVTGGSGDSYGGQRYIGGENIYLPQLGDRTGVMSGTAYALSSAIGGGQYGGVIGSAINAITGNSVNPALTGALMGSGTGNPFSTNLSPMQQEMLSKIKDPDQRAQMELQMMLQKQAELAMMISNIMNLMHSTSQAIIGNMRS